MPRGIQLLRAAGLRLAAGGASFYFTHPQRVVAELPPDLAVISQDVFRVTADGARLHAIWLPGRNSQDGRPHDRTIVHSHGFNGSAGVVLARSAFYQRGVLRLPSLGGRCAAAGLAAGAERTRTGLQFPAGGHARTRTFSRTVGYYRRQGHV